MRFNGRALCWSPWIGPLVMPWSLGDLCRQQHNRLSLLSLEYALCIHKGALVLSFPLVTIPAMASVGSCVCMLDCMSRSLRSLFQRGLMWIGDRRHGDDRARYG